MSEEDLNVKYIREKTGLVENDELIPIILEMIKDSYKAGLCQAEYDNTMDLMEENQKLRIQLSSREEVANAYKEVINKLKMICNKVPHDWSICGIEVVSRIENVLKEVDK